jgi:L-ribulokinase
VDFGTASVRVSIFDSERGLLGAGVVAYPVLRSPADPDFATQRHEDHLKSLEAAFAEALAGASVGGQAVEAVAVATTGSSVVMIDETLQPLSDYYLWCDHRAWREAAEITQAARAQKLPALDFAAAPTPPNGAGRRFSTGCAGIRMSATALPPVWNIAT